MLRLNNVWAVVVIKLTSTFFQYKSFFVLLFSALFLLSCKTLRRVATGKQIVFVADSSLFMQGKFDNETEDRIRFSYYFDRFFDRGELILEKNKKVAISSKTPILFQEESVSGSYIGYPGDTIIVKQDSNGVTSYSSPNAARSDELTCDRILNDKTTGLRYQLYGNIFFSDTLPHNSTSWEAELIEADSRFTSGLISSLDSLSDLFSLTDQYLMEKRAKFTSGFQLGLRLFYDTVSRSYRYRSLLIDNEGLKKKKQLLNLNTTTFSAYAFAIDIMYEYLLYKLGVKAQIHTADDFEKQFKIISVNFNNGIIRNYLLTKILRETLSKRINISTKYIRKYFRVCNNKLYKSRIVERINQVKRVKGPKWNSTNKDNIVDVTLSQNLKIEQLLANYKGKVILLDFWASWCVPCREELPHLKKLKEIYKKKSIEFINLSVDKDIFRWLDACKTEQIDNSNSFIIANPETFDWKSKYTIESIPRYILIGKDGQIISQDAPRPSDPALKQLIEKYL